MTSKIQFLDVENIRAPILVLCPLVGQTWLSHQATCFASFADPVNLSHQYENILGRSFFILL